MDKDSQTILKPGTACDTPQVLANEEYLLISNYLSEFADERSKQLARTNLGVLASSDTMRSTEIENYVTQAIVDTINSHLAESDPHSILPKVEKWLEGYVKSDGTVGFQGPVSGKTPVSESDLTTKKYVDDALFRHTSDMEDPHQTMLKVKEELMEYATRDHVYGKDQTYSQVQVDTLIKDMVKNDGSTPFKATQQGVYPKASADLTTKGYVDDQLNAHKLDASAHGFAEMLEKRLQQYYTKDQVYTKDETYSRAQLLAKIEELMIPVAEDVMNAHLRADDPHHTMEAVMAMNYVKADGTVPFTGIQKGVPGIESNDLATIGDVDYRIKQLDDKYIEDIKKTIWYTSGPVQTTVGHVLDNTELPAKVTFQEIMDSIFYGNGVYIECKDYAEYGEIIDVTMNIRPIMLIDQVKLYQDDVLIGIFSKADFEPRGEYTVKSNAITKDPTTFKMEVTYTNGNVKTVTKDVKIAYGVYIGIMPKWMSGSQMTINYMEANCISDPSNNYKFNDGDRRLEYMVNYNFTSPKEPKSLYIAMPVSYPSLQRVVTATQDIPMNQFESVDNIPLTLSDGRIVMYKLYILRVGLCELNMDVLYKLQS